MSQMSIFSFSYPFSNNFVELRLKLFGLLISFGYFCFSFMFVHCDKKVANHHPRGIHLPKWQGTYTANKVWVCMYVCVGGGGYTFMSKKQPGSGRP